MHISPDDFDCMTPEEFAACCEAWRDVEERREKEAWERARIETVYGLYPHMKGNPSPAKVMPFPWDKKSEGDNLTTAERKRLAREAVKQANDGK